ncbi:g1551 [Coccomyxa elongata]
MDSQRLGHVSLERLAGAGASRVRLQPPAPVKAELTQEDIVEEPEWPSLTYDEVVDARQAAGSLASTWKIDAKWFAELAQRWPPRLGRSRGRDMSASDVAALQNELLTRTAPQPQTPANRKGKGRSTKRARANEPSEPECQERSDSETPAPSEPSSSNDGSGSPLHTSALTAATDSVPTLLISASQGTVLRRSKRLRSQAGSPTPVDEPGTPGRDPAMVTQPTVTPPAIDQSRSVSASQEQGAVLRRSKRLRGEASSSLLVDEQGGVPAPVTKPAVTPFAAAESRSVSTCREQAVRQSTRANAGSHGAGGGSPSASAVSGPPAGPSADSLPYAWPKKRLASGSAGQDAAVGGSEASDAEKAAGVKNVSMVPEDLSARVAAILTESDLDQLTMRQLMERLQQEGVLGVSAKSIKEEVDRYLMQHQGTGTTAAVEGTMYQDSEDTLWKVSIEDELNTDFKDLRPPAASNEETRASLLSHSQLQPDTADAPPDLQAAALALYWALISLAGALRRSAGPAAPAPSGGAADADLAPGQPMTHPQSGPPPTAVEPSAGAAGAPADKASSQPMTLHLPEAPPAAANGADSASQETDQELAAPEAELVPTDLPAWPDVVGEPALHGARLQDAHLMQKSAGGGGKNAVEGAAEPVPELGSGDHAAEQAVSGTAADGARLEPSPSDAEDGHLDRSVSRAADTAFGLAYTLLEHLLARRWTEELRPPFGPTCRLTFSLPQLANFGAARPPRPSAAPAGARSGPAAGGPFPTGAGGPFHQADSPAEPRERGQGVRHGPAPHNESANHPEDSIKAGSVQRHSSGVGQRDAIGGTHVLDTGSEKAQQGSAAEAVFRKVGGDARLVFEAAAAVGVKDARPFQALPASIAWACRKLVFNSVNITVRSALDPVQTIEESPAAKSWVVSANFVTPLT